MKIALAQTNSTKGDIRSNILRHKRMIEQAMAAQVDMIIFPELSLTGYEPTLAEALAIVPQDNRLDIFQSLSDAGKITVGVGIPTKSDNGVCISMVIFQPNLERLVYSKKYLHTDEVPFFVSGQNIPVLQINHTNVGLAICYELTIPAHADSVIDHGADIYLASVAKTARGMEQAAIRMSEIAKKYSIPALISNCVGTTEGQPAGGQSAAWTADGKLLATLDTHHQGLLIYDTIFKTCETVPG